MIIGSVHPGREECGTYLDAPRERFVRDEIVGAAKRSIIPVSSGSPIATAGTQCFENHWIHSSRRRVIAAKMIGPTCRFAENACLAICGSKQNSTPSARVTTVNEPCAATTTSPSWQVSMKSHLWRYSRFASAHSYRSKRAVPFFNPKTNTLAKSLGWDLVIKIA